MENIQTIEIEDLDFDLIHPNDSNVQEKSKGFKLVIIGKPGSGKSNLIENIMYYKKHLIPCIQVTSGTEENTGSFAKRVPDTFVFNEYNEDQMWENIERQKLATKHLPNPWMMLILDDCTDEPEVLKRKVQQRLYKYGRHYNLLYILSLQYCLDIKPAIRTSIDATIIFRDPNIKNRKSLYENYAGIIPDFGLFCSIMDQITDEFTALYIHNMTNTNDWTKCVFWIKGRDMSQVEYKFGCKDIWDFHEARYDKEKAMNMY